MKEYKKLYKFINNNRAKQKLINEISGHPYFFFYKSKDKMTALKGIIDKYKIEILNHSLNK